MPLYLVPPGKRKGNRFYLIRGEIAGRSIEVSAKTADEAAALRFKAGLELKLLEDRLPSPGEGISFARAIDLYVAYRDPSKAERKRLGRLRRELGPMVVSEIRHAHLVAAANTLYPNRSPATRNREAMRPAAAVVHYCANAGFCPWLRVPLFKEARPRTRAVAQETAAVLVSNAPAGSKRLLLLWLFRQGHRISDALAVKWEAIDIKARTVTYRVSKTDRPEVTKPLHHEVWEVLASDPKDSGRLFPWHTKSGVYKWLRPFTKKLGIPFTPHMARHSLGKWLNEDGASLRLIMDALDHSDPKSSIRYQSTDIEVIRRAGRRLGKLVGRKAK